ncbi:hypothetical protein VPNG_07696 [Cytospora leucostoma]|uniref:hydroxyisourate hydrolase n=1 Tax=Cytospora leucostoma TaxID=1230097 RepID=A0A423W8F5_9PEZI|nr:hypothetical protein VPNG_07696 [Cytospora leucostoma]
MASPTKAPITCHILDTNLGQPARNVRVRLQLTPPSPSSFQSQSQSPSPTPSPSTIAGGGGGGGGCGGGGPPVIFESTTNEDGRVNAWLPYSSPRAGGEAPVYTLEDVLGGEVGGEVGGGGGGGGGGGRSRWTLRFDTGGYFASQGRETFFPEVTVVFEVSPGQHYHVPLLLAPFSYSTYRGS